MARLERIFFTPWEFSVATGKIADSTTGNHTIEGLPQIFWDSGLGWDEANLIALLRAQSTTVNLETVDRNMKHLLTYANFLEISCGGIDWRHFPTLAKDRPIVQFRGELIKARNAGILSPKSIQECMAAVVAFYRQADSFGFIDRNSPMWNDRKVVIPYYDAAGFKRTLTRVTTDLRIPNTTRSGNTVEDGLTPLLMEDMTRALDLANREEWQELELMLATGAFTGSRIGTITTLSINNLERAAPDSHCSGIHRIQVGPGTGVSTKFNVKGDILIPDQLLGALKNYAYSTRRLKREAKAEKSHKSTLFLTIHGHPYKPQTISRLMVDYRRAGARDGLKFLRNFKFHQTRATFGTWLMELALSVTTAAAAIQFVKEAMLHKSESSTLRYVKFAQKSRGKIELSKQFSDAFTGISKRDWNDYVT